MKTKINHAIFPVLLTAIFMATAITHVKGCYCPPKIEILSPIDTIYSTDSVPLCFTVNKPTSWIGYSLDGQASVTIPGNTTLSGLLDGFHYVVVYAKDTCGRMGESSPVHFGVDTTPPNVTDISQAPPKNNVLPEDKVKVNATVTDNLSGVKQVILSYTTDNETWFIVNMTNLEGNIWNATIPAFPYCTNVTYTIMAEDNVGNTVTTKEMEYDTRYHVIPEFPSFLIMPLLMITTLLAVIVYRNKQSKNTS